MVLSEFEGGECSTLQGNGEGIRCGMNFRAPTFRPDFWADHTSYGEKNLLLEFKVKVLSTSTVWSRSRKGLSNRNKGMQKHEIKYYQGTVGTQI